MDLMEEIALLKRARNAVVLAHNYCRGEVQDAADFTGDAVTTTFGSSATSFVAARTPGAITAAKSASSTVGFIFITRTFHDANAAHRSGSSGLRRAAG